MADSMSEDDSSFSDGTPPYVPDFGDSGMNWDFGTPNPSGDSITEILNKGLGPLSPEAINGSPDLYLNPQRYFAGLRANNPGLFDDTVSGSENGGDGGDLVGGVSNPGLGPHFPRTAPQNEFNLDYAPPGSLVRYDPVHQFSGDEGPSIYVTAHPAFESIAPWDPEYHTAIRILGDDGVVDTLGGQWGSTGNLVGEPNYPGDQSVAAIVRLPVPANQTPQQYADNLRAAAATYGNNQPYDPLPSIGGGYNSNSYVAGVIRAAGGVPPSLPVSVPGYGKPLPLNFAPRP